MSAELTEERVAALEKEILCGDDPLELTMLSLIAYWREREAIKANQERIPSCKHCGKVKSDHWGFGAHCNAEDVKNFGPYFESDTVPKL